MAGPFAPRESQPIADTRVVQTEQGGPSAISGIKDALAIAVPEITRQHAKSLQEDLTNKTDALQQALLAQSNPAIAKSLFSKEALENPTTKAAFKEYQEIRLAAEQGKLSPAYAKERLLVIQNEAIANAPEFEQELRAAMTQATGMDPQKSLYSRLLAENASATRLSPEQKAMEELDKEAARLGISREAVQHIALTQARAGLLQNELTLKKSTGEYNFLDLEEDVGNRAGGIMLDLVGQVRALNTSQGGLTPENIQNIKLTAGAAYASAARALQSGASGVPADRVASALATLEKQKGAIDRMVEDGSLQALATSNNTLDKARLEGKLLSLPDYSLAYLVGDKPGFLKMVEYLNSTSGNAAAKALLGDVNPSIAGFNRLSSAGVVQEYGKMGTGVKPTTPAEKQNRAVAASLLLSTKGASEEQYSTAVQEMDALGLDLKWSALGLNDVLINATKSPALKAAVVQTQVAVTSGLASEYMQLINNPQINASNFKVVDGNLVFSDTAQGGGGILGIGGQRGAADSAATADAQDFVKRFNTANRISAAHGATGTLPSTRYSGVQDYWEVITKAARNASAPAPKGDDTGPTRFVRDPATGKIVPEGGQ